MKPGELLTNKDLQKIYDAAKENYLATQNTDYESHLWHVLAIVMAYTDLAGLDRPKLLNRDYNAANPDID